MRSQVLVGAALAFGLAGCAGESGETPDFEPVADIKQLMTTIVEPSAEHYWDAVGWIMDSTGTVERKPATAEEWEAVRNAAFVLAESGLLEGHRATTTWWLAPLFRKRYPGVLLDESSMIVRSGPFVTAGAALSHVDLTLRLVRGISPQLASLTARYLIVDPRPSQSAYALTDHLVHSDPIVERFESWARGRLTDGFSLDDAARAVGSSKRTLARRMHSVLGRSPLSYFQTLRVERAVHLLKTSSASVDEVATRVGYADGATLRALLRRRLHRGVKEIRRTS